jgi:hypothetical protein
VAKHELIEIIRTTKNRVPPRAQPIAIGLAAARARGRNGGRKPKMTPAKLRLAQAAVGKRGTVVVADLCEELGISSQTLTGTSPLRAGYGSKERK